MGAKAGTEFGDFSKISASSFPDEARPIVVPVLGPARAAVRSPALAKAAARWLAAGVIAAGLFAMLPALWDIADYWRFRHVPGTPPVARWALGLLWISLLQVIYGLYLALTPHWTTARVISLVQLATASLFALLLGALLVASPSGWLASPTGWQLGAKVAGGQAALWCLCLSSIASVLAFFAGRLSWRWQHADDILRAAGRKAPAAQPQ